MQIDWLDPGYYKIRARAKGHWIPIFVYFEDGERDPETWELLSDQRLAAVRAPATNNPTLRRIAPERLFNRAHPCTKGEYEWLMELRRLSRPSLPPQ